MTYTKIIQKIFYLYLIFRFFQKKLTLTRKKTVGLRNNNTFSGSRCKKQLNNDTTNSPRIFLFPCWPILFEPIRGEKQNFTSFLLVEIKLFIKKTIMYIYSLKLLFRCLIVFLKSTPWCLLIFRIITSFYDMIFI